MRKITQQAVEAFMSGYNFKNGNTEVVNEGLNFPLIHLKLHGNMIAKRYIENGQETVMITDARWPTNTTKERLNGIPGVCIQQKSGKWFLNGKEWNGGWIKI